MIGDEFFTEDQICEILGIKLSTLKARRYCGTDHPPYQEIGTKRYYPKRMFFEWARKRPVIWEVKGAS